MHTRLMIAYTPHIPTLYTDLKTSQIQVLSILLPCGLYNLKTAAHLHGLH
jgi:hypothetical protein